MLIARLREPACTSARGAGSNETDTNGRGAP
jgi:hypothetical protein